MLPHACLARVGAIPQVPGTQTPPRQAQTAQTTELIDSDCALFAGQNLTMADIQMRLRPRKFPYRKLVPYETETEQQCLDNLALIVRNIYMCIKGDDLRGVVGTTATTARGLNIWTRELRAWIDIKCDMPLSTRIKLVRLYYNLALCGVDGNPIDKFISMFCILCKDDLFQDTVTPEQLDLDWKLLLTVMKKLAMPQQSSYDGNVSAAFSSLSRLAQMARHFIPASATLEIYQQVLEKVSIRYYAVYVPSTLY